MIVLLSVFYVVFKSFVLQGKVSFYFVLLSVLISVLLIYKTVLFSEHCFRKGSQKVKMTKEEQCSSFHAELYLLTAQSLPRLKFWKTALQKHYLA